MTMWQSNLSANPPWPGMLSEKSFILRPLFKPEAKKPPKGAMRAAKRAMTPAWI